MDITSLTTEAQQLITRKELGTPLQIYPPPTKSTILATKSPILDGIFLLGFVLGFAALFIEWVSSSDSADPLSIVYLFIFFGILAMIPLSIIGVAISNRKKRVVVCTLGVALLLPKDSESFRWKDVLATTRLVAPKGGLTYTVHCHDGRKIVFKGLSHLQDLAETIDVQLARAQHPR